VHDEDVGIVRICGRRDGKGYDGRATVVLALQGRDVVCRVEHDRVARRDGGREIGPDAAPISGQGERAVLRGERAGRKRGAKSEGEAIAGMSAAQHGAGHGVGGRGQRYVQRDVVTIVERQAHGENEREIDEFDGRRAGYPR